MSRVVGPIGLLVVWVMLWGEPSVGNLASGVVVVGVIVAVDRRLRRPRRHRVDPVGLVLLVVDLFRRLVVSSIRVVRTVLRPTPERLRSGVVMVPLATTSPLVATVLADMISLTPGTISVDVRWAPSRLFVHVLGLADPADVVDEVSRIERRVLRAIRPVDGADDAPPRTNVGRS
jgi:multicomponent Na+:H+ antiporter subunit E